MKSRRLSALAALADAGADHRRRHLDVARADLHRLERQRRELGEHARRYEREGLERARTSDIGPTSLIRQRAFVAQLVARVESLGTEIGRGETRVREAAARHANAVARGRALQSLRDRSRDEEAITAARAEQRLVDDTWRRGSLAYGRLA